LKQLPGAGTATDSFWEEFKNDIDYTDLLSLYIPIYKKHFNEADLQELIQFYESPIGKKLVEKTPQITAESMTSGQEWGMKLAAKVMERLEKK
jgi:uncharacterized protein